MHSWCRSLPWTIERCPSTTRPEAPRKASSTPAWIGSIAEAHLPLERLQGLVRARRRVRGPGPRTFIVVAALEEGKLGEPGATRALRRRERRFEPQQQEAALGLVGTQLEVREQQRAQARAIQRRLGHPRERDAML